MNMTAIAIIAIICWAIVSIVKSSQNYVKAKKNKDVEDGMDEYSKRVEQRLNEMSERIATLEKIVTDEKYNLKKEFEKL